MLTYKQNLIDTIQDIQIEVEAIRHTFVSTIEQEKTSFRPLAVVFTTEENKSLVIVSRPVVDQADYFSAISEMLFAYSSLSAHAIMLAVDAKKVVDDKEIDLLEIYVCCSDFCEVFALPYQINDDKVIWLEDQFNIYTLQNIEKSYDTNGQFHATIDIFEALSLHVHLHKVIFDYTKIRSYYLDNNFELSDYIDNPETFSEPQFSVTT